MPVGATVGPVLRVYKHFLAIYNEDISCTVPLIVASKDRSSSLDLKDSAMSIGSNCVPQILYFVSNPPAYTKRGRPYRGGQEAAREDAR